MKNSLHGYQCLFYYFRDSNVNPWVLANEFLYLASLLVGWLISIYNGFYAAGIAYFLNLYGIDKIGERSSFDPEQLQYVFSISLSVLILKESLSTYHWFGFLLVISGVVLSLMRTSTSSPRLATVRAQIRQSKLKSHTMNLIKKQYSRLT